MTDGNVVFTIIELIGGLGLFLYGMNLMSRGIERVAGSKLRNILRVFTKNKFFGLIVGLFFTAVIQSSSAATVMVVSFVNSGLMTLTEASGVILGANIGTTVTALLVSFNISKFAPIFIFLGALMAFYMKKPAIRKSGDIVIGFGLLFLGVSTMSAAMKALANIPSVMSVLSGFTNPLLAVLLGWVLTSVVQSSSVTVSIMVVMASQGLINPDICLFAILGCNIGACTSALIASVGGSKNAKRAAYIHFLFNLFSSIFLFVLLSIPVTRNAIKSVIVFAAGGKDDLASLGRQIAMAHFLFKVFTVIVFYPFMGLIIKLTGLLTGKAKDTDEDGEMCTKFIGQTLPNPAIAIVLAIQETYRMAHMAKDNLNLAMDCLYAGDVEKVKKVEEQEAYIDYLNVKISDYLVRINQNTLPIGDQNKINGYFHAISDIERIGDYADNVREAVIQLTENNISFSEESKNELRNMMTRINAMMDQALEMFGERSESHIEEIMQLENEVDDLEREYQLMHIDRLNNGQCSAQAGIFYSDIVSELERIADHAINIAFSVSESRRNKDEENHQAKIVLK